MLSREDNERFTHVGPGSPMGKLLRRYWHPVGCTTLVSTKPQRVKVLGEELVLYRGASGTPVLMQLRCAHRNLALNYGRVEGDSIRCAYHGWLYDSSGQCVAQPAEAEGSNFKDKIRLTTYRTEEVSGLIFAYMGHEPAPVLPVYDVLRMERGMKEIQLWRVGTSWFQAIENAVDLSHLPWLHGHTFPSYAGKKIIYHFEREDYGASLEMRIEGIATAEVYPYAFPTINRFALPPANAGGPLLEVLQYRVPIDDTSFDNYFVTFCPNNQLVRSDQRVVHAARHEMKFGEYLPLASDWWGIDLADQDRMVFEQQGIIADRTEEHLAASDGGVLLMRRMMQEGFAAIEKGEDPPCIIRDPAKQNVEFKLSLGCMGQIRAEDQDYSMTMFSGSGVKPTAS